MKQILTPKRQSFVINHCGVLLVLQNRFYVSHSFKLFLIFDNVVVIYMICAEQFLASYGNNVNTFILGTFNPSHHETDKKLRCTIMSKLILTLTRIYISLVTLMSPILVIDQSQKNSINAH
jgi:hypothetical protein